MMKQLMVLVLLFGFAGNAYAVEKEELQEFTRSSAETFAKCKGTFAAFAKFLKENNFADNAELTMGFSRGAGASAMYLLGSLKRETDPDAKFQYGIFTEYINSVAYGMEKKVASLIEINDIKEANIQLKVCIDLNKYQTELVGLLRKEMYNLP